MSTHLVGTFGSSASPLTKKLSVDMSYDLYSHLPMYVSRMARKIFPRYCQPDILVHDLN